MRLLADENVPVPSIRLLRSAGYVVEAMIEIAPGTADPEVLAHAREHGQILITFEPRLRRVGLPPRKRRSGGD
ncbi:MAG: DUF5615 family PIN-like protein, partial [Gemmatimonadetes bacterium]|nr:DUF5615 family PIN-like protein [Gemmatimonadota bacterium]